MSRNNSSSLKNKKRTVLDESDTDAESFSDCQSEDEGYSSAESEAESKSEEKKQTKKSKGKEKDEKKQKVKIKTEKDSRKNPKKKKKVDEIFDDTDVSIDMSKENVTIKKIKLQSNLLLVRRMVEVNENGKKWSYPALVFVRKMKDSKAFEFNLPLAIADNIAEAIKALTIKDEPPGLKLKM